MADPVRWCEETALQNQSMRGNATGMEEGMSSESSRDTTPFTSGKPLVMQSSEQTPKEF